MAEWLRCGWQKRGRHRHRRLRGPSHPHHCGQGQDTDGVPEDSRLGAHEAQLALSPMAEGIAMEIRVKLKQVNELHLSAFQWVFAMFPPLMTLHRYSFFWLSEALFPFLFAAGTSWFKGHFEAFLVKSYNVVKVKVKKDKLMLHLYITNLPGPRGKEEINTELPERL